MDSFELICIGSSTRMRRSTRGSEESQKRGHLTTYSRGRPLPRSRAEGGDTAITLCGGCQKAGASMGRGIRHR